MGSQHTVGAVMRYCILGEVRAFDGEGRPLDLGGRRQQEPAPCQRRGRVSGEP
jgi:hypothetical protein